MFDMFLALIASGSFVSMVNNAYLVVKAISVAIALWKWSGWLLELVNFRKDTPPMPPTPPAASMTFVRQKKLVESECPITGRRERIVTERVKFTKSG